MKFIQLLVVLLILSSCAPVSEERSEENAINNVSTSSTERNYSPEYLAKKNDELSMKDSETAYEMCVKALTEFYKATRNGTNFELDTFIENKNLRQYILYKIQYLSDLHSKYGFDKVEKIDVGEWEVEYTDDENGGFLYYKLPVDIKNTSVGSRGEVAEILVRNINGKLVIVDWYTGTKDGYDFMVRGENLTIDNPDIWNDREWVQQLNQKQLEFADSKN